MQFKCNDSYKIMEYQCEKCGCSEFIWNSRNNVCPFMADCRKCDGIIKHINWHHDQIRPDFIPVPGMRYFADFTKERAEEFARKRIAVFKGTAFELEPGSEGYEELYFSLVNECMNKERAMDLLTEE